MPEERSEPYKFIPHPEAHAMSWDALLEPVRRGVSDLLFRVAGAVQAGARSDTENREWDDVRETANSFLVHGTRGTGKTTVLLSAHVAQRDPDRYFGSRPDVQVAHAAAKTLHESAVWLDILDLEPLPPTTNMLTAMLTRLRKTVMDTGNRAYSGPHSYCEERKDSARQQLTDLIHSAALTWGSIKEKDTRSRANRQIAASELYANFRSEFRKAMTTLSSELGRVRGTDNLPHLILPIDNVDRSPEHLASIIKLAQMVACPNLWIVMAGDQEDVDTFLERAYWKELIKVGLAAGSTVKPGLGGEDESFVMARRQAAAASHRLLPPSHRIEVGLVQPPDTLNYHPLRKPDQPIHELFQETVYPSDRLAKEKAAGHLTWLGPEKIKILELFYHCADHKIFDNGKNERKPPDWRATHFTEAGRLALSLPARGVVNLWKMANWVINEQDAFLEPAIEMISRTMLRLAVDESSVPSRIGLELREQIVRRKDLGRTILDLAPPNPRLTVRTIAKPRFEVRATKRKPKAGFSSVTALNPLGMVLYLTRQPAEKAADDALPDLAAGWFAIFFDLLYWSGTSLVFRSPQSLGDQLVRTTHHAIGRDELRYEPLGPLGWPGPDWPDFISLEKFIFKWNMVCRCLGTDPVDARACTSDRVLRLMVAGWIQAALVTFSEIELGGENNHPFVNHVRKTLEEIVRFAEQAHSRTDHIKIEEGLARLEKAVIKDTCDLYSKCWSEGNVVSTRRNRKSFMRNWMELRLPLLFSNLYVPMPPEFEDHRRVLLNDAAHSDLGRTWDSMTPFILEQVSSKAGSDPASDGFLNLRELFTHAV